MDGGAFLEQAGRDRFDLIHADAWPGTFAQLDTALSPLRPGGLGMADDLLPHPTWQGMPRTWQRFRVISRDRVGSPARDWPGLSASWRFFTCFDHAGRRCRVGGS